MKRNVVGLAGFILIVIGGHGAVKAAEIPSKEAVIKLLNEYQKAPYAERGKFVVDRKGFEDVQETYYAGRVPVDAVSTSIISIKPGPKENYFTVVASHTAQIGARKDSANLTYYLVQTPSGLKLDWSSMTGQNAMTLKAWGSSNDKSMTLRAEIKIDDYFTIIYPKGTYYCFALITRNTGSQEMIWGYAETKSELGKQLFDMLKDGKAKNVTVEIKKTNNDASFVDIKSLVSETWVIDKTK